MAITRSHYYPHCVYLFRHPSIRPTLQAVRVTSYRLLKSVINCFKSSTSFIWSFTISVCVGFIPPSETSGWTSEHPPLGKLTFHPGAIGPEHHGIAPSGVVVAAPNANIGVSAKIASVSVIFFIWLFFYDPRSRGTTMMIFETGCPEHKPTKFSCGRGIRFPVLPPSSSEYPTYDQYI